MDKIVNKQDTSKTTSASKLMTLFNWNSSSARLKLFFKANRLCEEDDLLDMFSLAWEEDPMDTMRICFYKRDCREGEGERRVFQLFSKWLIANHPDYLLENLEMIPYFGYWKDLLELFIKKEQNLFHLITSEEATLQDINEQAVESATLLIILDQLKEDHKNMLAGKTVSFLGKWLPTENCAHDREYDSVNKICLHLGIGTGNRAKRIYRKKYLTPLREYLQVVESLMSARKWDEIKFNNVPSVALKRLKEAFHRHCPADFRDYLDDRDLVRNSQIKENRENTNFSQTPYDTMRNAIDDVRYSIVTDPNPCNLSSSSSEFEYI